ncbi:MAG: site-2 protease family protein [Clostridiales bacterium]|nr:site-2 protease family protein [Clostridiales bacterium]MDD7034858.1 site-2 protease family protein [Bacillota bacterium]MDY2920434.1 site-2 protease family protein [Lentihominibacter sp.]
MRRNNIDITMVIIILVLAASSLRSGAFSDPKEWLLDKILLIPAVIIGLSFHEFGHAAVAYRLGDGTPKAQGRVTLNPLAHIDWMGLAALFFCGFGWGKPVQINPYNFKHRRRDEFLVALAGVVMNLLTAVVFAVIAHFLMGVIPNTTMGEGIWTMIMYIIQINLVLMIFNLIPCPPLDGFNILAEIFGFGNTETYWRIYQYGNWILVAIIIFGITDRIIGPCVSFLFNFLWQNIIF